MKKLLKLVLLVGLFISYSSSDVFSQTITNTTDCTFQVTVFYSSTGCNSQVVTVAPNSVSATLPAKISAAGGAAVQLTLGPCSFRLTDGDCVAPANLTATVNCGLGAVCSNYTATLDPMTGSLVIN